MTTHFVFHDAEGRIWQKGYTEDAMFALMPDELEGLTKLAVPAATERETHYVSEGHVLARPEMDAAFDRTSLPVNETAAIAGLPATARVFIHGPDGFTQEEASGRFEFTPQTAGDHLVTVDAFPAQRKSFVLNVGTPP